MKIDSYEFLFFCFQIGTGIHEASVYIRRPTGSTHRHITNEYEFLFYDSNERVNMLSIGLRFTELFPLRYAKNYVNGLHKRLNDDEHCAHLSWLEIYLNFALGVNPFDREDLKLQDLRVIVGEGHYGPESHYPEADPPYVHSGRNLNIPKNQMPQSSSAKKDGASDIGEFSTKREKKSTSRIFF